MKILAIDYGIKHIGLAYSEGEIAEPLGEIIIKDKLTILDELLEICQKHKIDFIVMGIAQGRIKGEINDFALKLEVKTGLPIMLQDETLTTDEAIKKMIESGKSRKERQQQEHIIAACLILQNYLDQQEEKM